MLSNLPPCALNYFELDSRRNHLENLGFELIWVWVDVWVICVHELYNLIWVCFQMVSRMFLKVYNMFWVAILHWRKIGEHRIELGRLEAKLGMKKSNNFVMCMHA